MHPPLHQDRRLHGAASRLKVTFALAHTSAQAATRRRSRCPARWLGAGLWAREGHPSCDANKGEAAAVPWCRSDVGPLSHTPLSSHCRCSPLSLTHLPPSSPSSPLTARCPVASQEDCKYCAQSTRHKTKVKATPMMQKDEVLEAARRAKMAGYATTQGSNPRLPHMAPTPG